MLEALRKRSGSLVITFIVAAIIFVFIFWGIGTIDGSKRQGAVAFVNGDRISAEDYLEELTKTVNIYRNFLGEKFDRKLLEQFNIKRQALDALITRKLVLHETQRLHVKIPDLELKDAIQSTQAFQLNGRFSPQRYRDLLAANRLTPRQYEGDQRRELIFQKIGSFIRRNTLISPLEAKTNYMIDNDRINLSFIKIDPNQFSKDVQVSPDEIAKFLETEESKKRIEEYYQLNHTEKKLDEVKNEIAEKLLKEEKSALLAQGLASQIIERLKEKKNVSDLLKRYQLSEQETGFFTREYSFVPKIGESRNLLRTAFQLSSESPLSPQALAVNEALYVISLKERKRPDLASYEKEVGKMIQQELERKQAQAVSQWLDHLRDSAKIKVNEGLLQTLSL